MELINAELQQDLNLVEDRLRDLLTGSDLEQAVNTLCLNTVEAGGKRLRPSLALLSWYALNRGADHEEIINFASSIELLHTATLIHDDVIDRASYRRGVKTINETEGNHIAVLAGDYLFTRCFFSIQEIENRKIVALLNETLKALVSGEINQLKHNGDLGITLADYENTIYCKTGALFELAAAGPAYLSQQSQEICQALGSYGKELGIAFQVIDDVLDYSSTTTTLGKDVGEDLKDGRITLPLIIALQRSGSDREKLVKAVKEDDLDTVLEVIRKTSAIEFCTSFASQAVSNAKRALESIADSNYRQMLYTLADKAIELNKQM